MHRFYIISGYLIIAMSCAVIANGHEYSRQLDLSDLSNANNNFGIGIYQKLSQKEGNVFISPYSISSALAMTVAGARGDTAVEMQKVLRFDQVKYEVHKYFESLNRTLESNDSITLKIANSLWPDEAFSLAPEFVSTMKKNYGVDLASLDYSHATEAARLRINNWVEKKTEDRITNLLPTGSLDPSTVMVLVNAIYFKGDWATQFNSEKTIDGYFNNAQDKKQKARFMRMKKKFRYAEVENLKILELPYAEDNLAMVIMLPQDGSSLTSIEKSLTTQKLNTWLHQMQEVEVDVTIPSFKIEWGTENLTEALKTMGMKTAFSGSADFTGMSPGATIHIDSVLHKTFIEVNEQGSEAAAATAVLMRKTAMIHPKQFLANHPFLFFIRDVNSGTILFLGRLSDL